MYFTIQDAFDDLHNVPDDTVFYILNSHGAKVFPVDAHSYRGVYDDVAFSVEPRTGTVGEFRVFLNSVVGQKYWSRGGQQHEMNGKTFIHIAEPGMLGESPVDIKLMFEDGDRIGHYAMQTEEE